MSYLDKYNRDSLKHYLLFIVLLIIVCAMSLMGRDSLNGVYHFFAHLLSINEVWVSGENATAISNTGHILACFLLTWIAFQTFHKSYIKAVVFVAGLACLMEFLQTFSATRQATFEDVLFSLSGVFMDSVFIFFLNRFARISQGDK